MHTPTHPFSFKFSVENFSCTLKTSENRNYWNGKVHISDYNVHLLFCFPLWFLKQSMPFLLNPVFSFKKDFKGKRFTAILCGRWHSPRKDTAWQTALKKMPWGAALFNALLWETQCSCTEEPPALSQCSSSTQVSPCYSLRDCILNLLLFSSGLTFYDVFGSNKEKK